MSVQLPGSLRTATGLLARYSSGAKGRIFAGLALLFVGAALSLLQPWPLKLIVDSVLGTAAAPPVLAGWSRIQLLGLLCAAMVALQIVVSVVYVASTQILVEAGLRMVFKLRCAVFDHVQRLSLAFHDATTVGDSMYRVAWDTYSVQALFNSGLVPILNAVVTLGGTALILFSQDWTLGAVAMIAGIPLIFLIRLADKSMSGRSMAVHERESDVTARIQETLVGIRAVQAFGREDDESERFGRHADASVRANLRLTFSQTLFQSMVSILMSAAMALIIWITATRALGGRLTAGDVVMVAAYVAMFYKPIEMLAYTAAGIQQASAGAQRVIALLNAPRDVTDSTGATPFPDNVRGAIQFENITFAYREGRPVLRDLALTISAGRKIALVGPSGAGKSTLVNLLLRFYDVNAGRITIDGRDIRDVMLRSLRQHIAIVPQEPVLFGASICENIAYSRPAATFPEIEKAARDAGAHEFIVELSNGYDTPIGERGILLSGGQRQRISLARAFLKNAPILIMDEPTGALDAETEHAVMQAADRLSSGRTTIIIAHRLSTVRNADSIIVMKDGQVVEIGDHNSLFSASNLYRRLHDLQFQQTAAAVPVQEEV